MMFWFSCACDMIYGSRFPLDMLGSSPEILENLTSYMQPSQAKSNGKLNYTELSCRRLCEPYLPIPTWQIIEDYATSASRAAYP